ncbi:MAG: alpha-L-arabinofuranosidase [Planctomycetes bacterium]|nr:alpha-L-arabinofuranosidase [Planctomycetota bacterium]
MQNTKPVDKILLSRRAALRRLTAAAAAALGAMARVKPARGASRPSAAAIAVRVLLDERRGSIRPALYGHFTEHIGGVIYDGIWVGPQSKIPNLDGIRLALVEHVRRLGPVAVRWPGGCFADRYHWRDGIGPRERRPRRFGRWRDDTEPNHFGTHEFVRFCRLCGVEPYFAANVGTGSPEEFQQWVEYANAPPGSTSLAEERASNGDREPFKVRAWGVGNESWGCGGKFTPEDYCAEYRRFTEWVPGYGVPLYLIAAGPSGNDLGWTRRFFARWADGARAPIHGWAPHYYCGTTGHALEFSTDQWYEMLHKANHMEKLIADQWAALGEFDRERRIKLVIDEWGAWHPAGTEINKAHLFEQMGCLRDALAAALTLDTFNRHAEKIDMANVAQLVNNLHSLFLADGEKFVPTPTFHVFEMYRPHQGAEAVRLEIDDPGVAFKAGGREEKIFRLAGSASVSQKKLTLTLVHAHASEPAEVSLQLRGAGAAAAAAARTVLAHPSLNAHNTFENPQEVVPRTGPLDQRGAELRIVLPAASVNRLDISL